MERKNFLRALGVLVFSPKIVGELKPRKRGNTKGLFKDMQFIQPDWTPQMMAKYGDKSFAEIINEMGRIS